MTSDKNLEETVAIPDLDVDTRYSESRTLSSRGINKDSEWQLPITICAIVRNEAPYIYEWIAYHKAIGVTEFVIYDNESDDETSNILIKLQKIGTVVRIPWLTPDVGSPQLLAYSDFLQTHSISSHFVSFLDVDEFLALPPGYSHLGSYCETHGLTQDNVSAVAINQRVFGSSGKLRFESDLVTRRFTKAAAEHYSENHWCKTLFRASRVVGVENPHVVRLRQGRYVDVAGNDLDPAEIRGGQTKIVCDGLRVNHYIIKSFEEFKMKQARGGVSGATSAARAARYDDNFFYSRDANLNSHEWAFTDSVIQRFLVILGSMSQDT